jgi:tRNA pseudouridine38-40 synthase
LPYLPKKSTTIHNYFLRIAYDGTDYRGWQRQPGNVVTIQQTIEELLSKVHHREVTVGGCGRTDAGVHASQYYLSLRVEQPLPEKYFFFINKQLPTGLSLLEIIPVADRAQTRFDATQRTYDYFLHTKPDAFLDRFSSRVDLTDFAPAAAANTLPLFLKYTDFRAFCKTPDRHNTTFVHFKEVTLYRNEAGDRFRIRFVANRFLRGMIRLLVNDLLLVGRGQLSAAAFEQMLVTKEREPHFRLAPPQGLFLTGVKYPDIDREAELPVSGEIQWTSI